MTEKRVNRNNIVVASISLFVLMMCTKKRSNRRTGCAVQPYTCAIFVSYSLDGQRCSKSILKSGIEIAPGINVVPGTFDKNNNCIPMNKQRPGLLL